MSSFFQAKSYLRHWLYEVDEHSIHSPFFFDIYTRIIKKSKKHDLPVLEDLRFDLRGNRTVLSVEDFGSGAQKNPTSKKSISEIARTSLTPFQSALFYLDMMHYSKAHRVIELGTSLGVTSLYLAQKKDATIYTFEGSHAIANVAQTNFEWSGKKNIQLVEGNIDNTLQKFLEQTNKIDFVLMDANHRYGATMRYYHLLTKRLWEGSIVIIDDIHRSEEMEKAWREIRNDVLVYGSIDLYRCGVLFFEPSLNKQQYTWSLN